MGVPALFRWLSKKYPKIVQPVLEDEPFTVPVEDGTTLEMPLDITGPNPNGIEFDNLYLDANGIVHPCTHPEGRPAPETEEEMMLEIFRYTERVVSMIRPRKLLFIAIDGVAPRAKMNQQRSRRFRSSQEAKEKEEERREAIKMFEGLGHAVSEETKSKKSWDSNAITPGTPFMDLLASSLRYWVTEKLNTDPGWKNLQVIISDSSVPGEGEHKIMDWIRRQRINPDHDPNTQHVIYGLDADLIMLALATHEPNFRVLREDVFAQDNGPRTCRVCGQEGHIAANCTGEKKFDLGKKEEKVTKPADKKPFITLDVAILREYLEIELNVPNIPFPFDLERALDDWIFMIFFVGNDFLPHLPSLEIREGAIDTLLKIWKDELPRMGGYLTNHGHVEMDRAQIILTGLASRESAIFQKRREVEERQDQNAKRRKIEDEARQNRNAVKTSNGRNSPDYAKGSMHASNYVAVPAKPAVSTTSATMPAGLPPRPSFDMFLKKDTANGDAGQPAPPKDQFQHGTTAMAGSNHDVVANRHSIRMANMSAAEALKAEMASMVPLGRNAPPVKADEPRTQDLDAVVPPANGAEALAPAPNTESSKVAPEGPPGLAPVVTVDGEVAEQTSLEYVTAKESASEYVEGEKNIEVPGDQFSPVDTEAKLSHVPLEADLVAKDEPEVKTVDEEEDGPMVDEATAALDRLNDEPDVAEDNTKAAEDSMDVDADSSGSPRGTKRKAEDVDDTAIMDDDAIIKEEDDDEPTQEEVKARKINADGTVDQEDTVKLWEPGYRERYYRQKFGVELSDKAFRKKLTMHYMEGLSWVLHYYYQGTPSWQWFYPFHFAPFAADFEDIGAMEIKFNPGQPFKPFEQLMSVFPAASRVHLPLVYQPLMTESDSPIIDFYPEEFEIDMNGKKMAWQGVALLPFIDETRLLQAMQDPNSKLSPEEKKRNTWGSNSLFVSDGSPLHDFLCGLYTKRRSKEPTTLDTKLAGGIAGTVLADPEHVPGSTLNSPLVSVNKPDITDNRSITVLYYYPKQAKPHRSVLLPGARRPKRILTPADADHVRRGGNPDRRGHGRDNAYSNQAGFSRQSNGKAGAGGGAYGSGGYSDAVGSNTSGDRGNYRGDSSTRGRGSYGSAPPPASYGSSQGYGPPPPGRAVYGQTPPAPAYAGYGGSGPPRYSGYNTPPGGGGGPYGSYAGAGARGYPADAGPPPNRGPYQGYSNGDSRGGYAARGGRGGHGRY